MNAKALIDGDSLLYKAGFSFEEKTNWNELDNELGATDETDISLSPAYELSKKSIVEQINIIKEATKCDSIELWLSGHNNFRFDVLPTYKHNRLKSRKPMSYDYLWNFLIKEYKANVAEGCEADDVVVYKKTNYPDDYILCAIDKDVLYQTAGYHYNYGNGKWIEVTPKEAHRFFYYQILVGDTVDGYKGVVGIGKTKANKLLDNTPPDEYWNMCIETAMKAMNFEKKEAIEYLLPQARVANMHQITGKNEGKFNIELWTPNM